MCFVEGESRTQTHSHRARLARGKTGHVLNSLINHHRVVALFDYDFVSMTSLAAGVQSGARSDRQLAPVPRRGTQECPH